LNASVCESISVVDLGVGLNTSCAVLSIGTISCWGDNQASLLGHLNKMNIGDDELPSSVPPVTVGASGIGVRKIALGGFDACALLSDGNVKCWGSGFDGETGQGNKQILGDDEPLSSIPAISVTRTPGVTATQIVIATGADGNGLSDLGHGYGLWYSGRAARTDPRSVLHHEARRSRDGPRPIHHLLNRSKTRRLLGVRERGGRRDGRGDPYSRSTPTGLNRLTP
jgi:hypothetical protein